MASPENILLYLADEQAELVTELFARLAERGFPVQRQTPHVTISFAPRLEPRVVERAAELLPPVIPARLKRVGTVEFGTKRKRTLAWLLEAPDELEIAAREISALNPDGRGPRWIPHLTIGLRLPREYVSEYRAAVEELTPPGLRELVATRAGYWQPATRTLFDLGQ